MGASAASATLGLTRFGEAPTTLYSKPGFTTVVNVK
jgi:hypothetical protein